MVTIAFEKVALSHTKKIKCPICKKTTQKTREFYQTVSPFNRDKDGLQKSIRQIYEEVNAEMLAWKESPLLCNKCE